MSDEMCVRSEAANYGWGASMYGQTIFCPYNADNRKPLIEGVRANASNLKSRWTPRWASLRMTILGRGVQQSVRDITTNRLITTVSYNV